MENDGFNHQDFNKYLQTEFFMDFFPNHLNSIFPIVSALKVICEIVERCTEEMGGWACHLFNI